MIHVKNPAWQVAKFALEASTPHWLGFVYYKADQEYTDAMFQDFISDISNNKRRIKGTEAYWLDFNHMDGRVVNLSVATADGMDGCVLSITPTQWYDHSQQQINQLLSNLVILNDNVSLDVLNK